MFALHDVFILNFGAELLIGNGAGQGKGAGGPLIPDRDQVNHILGKIHSLRAANSASRSSVPGGFDLNVSQVAEQPFEHPTNIKGNTSTTDLLAVLSTALGASSPDAVAALSQAGSDSSGDDKTKITCAEPVADINIHNQAASIFSSVASGSNRYTVQTHLEVSKDPVEKAQTSLPLQLFSSVEDDSPPKIGSMRKYLSSESSNPMDDRSPSSSPPFAQKLFPLHSTAEGMRQERASDGQDNSPVETSTSQWRITPLDLFKKSERRAENSAVQNLPCQNTFSGSDHSPSSSNSDGQVMQYISSMLSLYVIYFCLFTFKWSSLQDRTGRIIFKLFDKDPSSFPGALRTQVGPDGYGSIHLVD